jgi:DNA polymerase (family X)
MDTVRPTATSRLPLHLPLDNETIAERLEEIADLFEGQDSNPYRPRAYRNAAEMIRGLDEPIADLLDAHGRDGLTDLPGVGDSIARTVERLIMTGTAPLLERIRGRSEGEAVLATVPGVGPKTAARIRAQLGIRTLADLEMAAYDGRLACLPGIGRKRLLAVRDSLAGRFQRHPRARPVVSHQADWQPPIADLLSIDEEYRRKAQQGRLVQVAPVRFNPTGKAWLPILRTGRQGRRFTALYSNTPRAHELGMTHDWVVIYREHSGESDSWTVVTSHHGSLKGKRVRGREPECDAHYSRQSDQHVVE